MSLKDAAQVVEANLNRIIRNGVVPIGVAQKLVRDSAWWHGHPSGPTRAPKHYERITQGDCGWEIEFGANKFLVEEAIRRCIPCLRAAVRVAIDSGARADLPKMREIMVRSVQSSVANYSGEAYAGGYESVEGYLLFGTQAIRVVDFVDSICAMSEIQRIA